MAEISRSLKVGELIKRTLAELLREQVRDPRIKVHQLIVSDVDVSADLSLAKVYMRTMGSGDIQADIERLNEMAGFLRTRLSSAVRLKKIPGLKFLADKSQDNAARIEHLLRTSGAESLLSAQNSDGSDDEEK